MKKFKIILLGVVAVSLITVIGYYTIRRPLVSVVMPVYNRADTIRKAIDSILNQTFTDFEFIIVDDGSTDGTTEILDYYAKKDSRVRVLKNEQNRGISYSRNKGNDSAKGKYIAIMDSDDYSVPNRLEKQVAYLEANPEVDSVIGTIRSIKDLNISEMSEKFPANEAYQIAQHPGHFEIDLFFYNFYSNVTSMVRKDFVKDKGIWYNPAFISAEDYDFWKQFIIRGGQLASLSDVLVYVRFHSSNSPKYYKAMETNSIEIHRQLFSIFFMPEEKELKFHYNTYEKCHILLKIMEGNKKKHLLVQSDIQRYYDKNCPQNTKDSLYLIHPFWNTFLQPDDNNLYKRLDVDEKAHIVQDGDILEVKWLNFPPEKFVRIDGNSYQFIPTPNKVWRFIHPVWEDDFYVDGTLFYKMSTKEKGKIIQKTDDTVVLKWDTSSYAVEMYKKDPQTQNWVYEKDVK